MCCSRGLVCHRFLHSPQRDHVQIGNHSWPNNDTGTYRPSQLKAISIPIPQRIAPDDERSLLNVPTLLPPSERGSDYTEQDAIRNQYMKQYRLEGYFEGEEFIQTSEGPGRLSLSEDITAEELQQFRNELIENGLGYDID